MLRIGAGGAQLVPDEIGESPVVADVADKQRGNGHAKAEPANRRPDRVVVGKLVGKRLKSADFGQSVPAKGDGRAEARFGEAELKSDKHIRQKMAVDRVGCEAGPDPICRQPTIEAADKPDTRLGEGRDHAIQISGWTLISLSDKHDEVVARVRKHIDYIRYFWVGAVPCRVGAECDVALGKSPSKSFDDFCSGIRLILNAENELSLSAIVLLAEGCEIGLELGLHAVKWLKDRDGRRAGSGDGAFLGKLSQKGCRNQRVEAA